jgi:hypothetical protein
MQNRRPGSRLDVVARLASIAVAMVLLSPLAHAQQTCLQDYMKIQPASGFTNSVAEEIVDEVKAAQGIVRNVKIVECPFTFAGKAVAVAVTDLKGVPAGEYIVYDATWLREVIGDDRDLAFILIAHEIGHFVNGDYAPGGNSLSRATQELAADRFAACSAARARKPWAGVENLLSRIRRETAAAGSNYHDRFTSLAAAKSAYEACSGGVTTQLDAKRKSDLRSLQNFAGRWGGKGDSGRCPTVWPYLEVSGDTVTVWSESRDRGRLFLMEKTFERFEERDDMTRVHFEGDGAWIDANENWITVHDEDGFLGGTWGNACAPN